MAWCDRCGSLVLASDTLTTCRCGAVIPFVPGRPESSLPPPLTESSAA